MMSLKYVRSLRIMFIGVTRKLSSAPSRIMDGRWQAKCLYLVLAPQFKGNTHTRNMSYRKVIGWLYIDFTISRQILCAISPTGLTLLNSITIVPGSRHFCSTFSLRDSYTGQAIGRPYNYIFPQLPITVEWIPSANRVSIKRILDHWLITLGRQNATT